MIFCDLLCIFKVHCDTLVNLQTHRRAKKINYNRVLRRPSPPLHLVGGVLLGRAHRGCNGEARDREKVVEHLPRSAFECKVTGNKLVGVNGGGEVRVAGGVGEGGLGVEECRTHEHLESMRKLLG